MGRLPHFLRYGATWSPAINTSSHRKTRSGRLLYDCACALYIEAVDLLACVASVSREGAKKKKKGGRGRERGEEETLARKPHDSEKRPLIFHGSVDL